MHACDDREGITILYCNKNLFDFDGVNMHREKYTVTVLVHCTLTRTFQQNTKLMDNKFKAIEIKKTHIHYSSLIRKKGERLINRYTSKIKLVTVCKRSHWTHTPLFFRRILLVIRMSSPENFQLQELVKKSITSWEFRQIGSEPT